MQQKKITAIIMAAGFSRRMPEKNKLLLSLDGKQTLFEHTIAMLAATNEITEIIAVVRTGEFAQLCAGKVDKTVFNVSADEGISASIRQGVRYASGEYYLFLPADQPLLQSQHIQQICACAERGKIVVPCADTTPKGPCLFSYSFKNELLSLQGDTGGKQIIRRHSNDVIYTKIVPKEALDDADTKEAYEKLKRISKKI